MNPIASLREYARRGYQHGRRHFRRATAPARRLPDVLIIGAQKSGTTSLYNYLCQHPRIHGSSTKEVRYFDDHFDRGERWYRKHFPIRRDGLTLEATPNYIFHRDAFHRIASLLPEAKLIAVLREPVARAYSQYRMFRRWNPGRRGHEPRSFEEAVRADLEVIRNEDTILGGDSDRDRYRPYVRRSLYAPQVRRYIKVYGENMLVIPSQNLFTNTKNTMREVFNFLGYSPINIQGSTYNRGDYKSKRIPLEKSLKSFFSPYNSELYDILGVGAWWRYSIVS